MKNTIIHPTDFSDCANNALEYAVKIAKALDLKIMLVHSLDFSDFDITNQNATILNAQTEEIKFRAEEKLKELAKKINLNKIECHAKIFNGRLGSWLPDFIKEENPRYVVMGTTGSSNITNKIIGSNTYSIIKSINIPLLAVPKNATLKEFNQFVFSTDYKDADLIAIKSVSEIAKYYSAKIDIVHILNKKTNVKINTDKLIDNLKNEVFKHVQYDKIYFKLLYGENIHERLQILTKEIKPNLLALVMRKQNFFERLFFGSLTEKLAYQSDVAVFIFPSDMDQ